VTDGGDLFASAAAAMGGGYGLQADLDDSVAIYLRDDTPNQARSYQASFWFDPNSIGMSDRNHHFIFQGESDSGLIIRIAFMYLSGNYQVQVMVRDDNNLWRPAPWVIISDDPHHIELEWHAASAAGANDGSVSLAVDGANQTVIGGLDNDSTLLDQAFLGAVTGIDLGTRGTYYFDEFVSYP
jgi:hypothetical protein